MATDTAFALAIIALMGARVPVEHRIFLTAASIGDDIGAIIVVAIFYSGDLRVVYLVSAAAITALLSLLNRAGIYHAMPYVLAGVALWACVYMGGLRATLAGVTIGSESFNGRGLLMLSIVAALTVGKPLGFALASAWPLACIWRKGQGLHLAPAHGCWGTGRCGLYDVALRHCRTGVSARRGFRRRQDCSFRGVHAVGRARHGRALRASA